MKDLGEKLRKARLDRGLGRQKLLDRANIESGPSRLANYESGLREPSLEDLERLAQGLGLDLIELLQYGDEQPLVRVDEDQQAVLKVWSKMEKEEQNLWLSRGEDIIKTRLVDITQEKLWPAGQKNAHRVS